MPTSLRRPSKNLSVTPNQVEGPFFPGEERFYPRRDLTREPGAPREARGERVNLTGDVRDPAGRAIAGARVRLWQACASGRYRDERDLNPAPLDPCFGYWGLCVTDARGRFDFRTVVPGEYRDTDTWTRPPHLHFRVSAPGHAELTTQLYFAGHHLNEKDLILEATPRAEWSRLVVDFRRRDGELSGRFAIVLARCSSGS